MGKSIYRIPLLKVKHGTWVHNLPYNGRLRSMNGMPTILVLVGITGDLARRKLLPAIEGLRAAGALPEKFELVGITRRENANGYFVMNHDDPQSYTDLAAHLENIEKKWGEPAQRLFYLSVAPSVSLSIITHLGESGLSHLPNTKLLVEKPFGTNYEDAAYTIEEINKHFAPEQQYRVDHYLAKGSVRALAAQAHALSNVSHIDILASEALSIEGRTHFYEQTGALRDLIQSHLLEVAAVAINPTDRLAALKGLSVRPEISIRGQYNGYRTEAGNPDSATETFASILLESKNAVFNGTVRLTTGKALAEKRTELQFMNADGTTKSIDLSDSHNAYEHVFADAMAGDHTWFVSPDEALEDWRIVKPVQEAWSGDESGLKTYVPGTRADTLY